MDAPQGGKTRAACNATSVATVRTIPTTIPASTAPTLRPVLRVDCVSVMTGPLPFPSRNGLGELWREVRHHHESRIDLLYEFPIGFGLVANALPLRVIAKRLPVGSGGFTVGMRKHVNEGLPLKGFVGGGPIRHVLDSVLLEQFCWVFAKAAEQAVQLAFVRVVDAKVVGARCRW